MWPFKPKPKPLDPAEHVARLVRQVEAQANLVSAYLAYAEAELAVVTLQKEIVEHEIERQQIEDAIRKLGRTDE